MNLLKVLDPLSDSAIIKSCGYCGRPMDKNGKDIWPVPEGYNPDNYPHDVCIDCGNEEMSRREGPQQYVTHEMAMDAQNPDLEGMPY